MNSSELAIIGAAGSVGRILVDRLAGNGGIVHCIDTNETELHFLKQEWGEQVRIYAGDYATTFMVRSEEWRHLPVVHAAAYKHVGFCEDQVRAAAHNNITKFGRFLNESGITRGTYISTDKAVEPRGMMGMTKAIAERMALEAGWNVVRFGNVWGSRGSVADMMDRQIATMADGEEMKINLRGGMRTHRFAMTEEDVCHVVGAAVHLPEEYRPSVVVPDGLEEESVHKLIGDTFNYLKGAHNKDIRLRFSHCALNLGEKEREIFLWPEEEDRAESPINKVKVVSYADQYPTRRNKEVISEPVNSC